RKEIVLMMGEKSIAYTVMDELSKKFNFKKPNHGIAFSTSIMNPVGCENCSGDKEWKKCGGVKDPMYNVIYTIVDKGKTESVMEADTKVEYKGGTIINERGTGKHETSKVFSMEIEPEKEIVLILAESKQTQAIVSSIRDNVEIDKPGNGVIFVQN